MENQICKFPLCKKYAVRDEFCISHAKYFAGEKEAKRPKPISVRSVKRMAEERLYAKKKKEYLTINIKCEVKGCNQVSVDIHHKKGRVGKLLFNEKYFMAVCRDHHTEIENHPELAIKNGYSVKRLNETV